MEEGEKSSLACPVRVVHVNLGRPTRTNNARPRHKEATIYYTNGQSVTHNGLLAGLPVLCFMLPINPPPLTVSMCLNVQQPGINGADDGRGELSYLGHPLVTRDSASGQCSEHLSSIGLKNRDTRKLSVRGVMGVGVEKAILKEL